MITVRANARNATYISDDLITSGSVGIPVTFVLSEDFDGLSAIAVFEGSGTARDVALMGNTCVVPHEVLATAGGYLRIGIYASNSEGTIVIPTVWAGSKLILQGTEPSEVDPSEPTPSWAAQVQAAAAEALANSEEAIEIAGGADAAAADARQSASAAATSATAAEQSASAASGSATSASGSATAAAQSATSASGSATSASGSATAAANSATAAAASEAAAREVEESIPADYSELSAEVGDLKSQIEPIADALIAKQSYSLTATESMTVPNNIAEQSVEFQITGGVDDGKIITNKTKVGFAPYTPDKNGMHDFSEETNVFDGIVGSSVYIMFHISYLSMESLNFMGSINRIYTEDGTDTGGKKVYGTGWYYAKSNNASFSLYCSANTFTMDKLVTIDSGELESRYPDIAWDITRVISEFPVSKYGSLDAGETYEPQTIDGTISITHNSETVSYTGTVVEADVYPGDEVASVVGSVEFELQYPVNVVKSVNNIFPDSNGNIALDNIDSDGVPQIALMMCKNKNLNYKGEATDSIIEGITPSVNDAYLYRTDKIHGLYKEPVCDGDILYWDGNEWCTLKLAPSTFDNYENERYYDVVIIGGGAGGMGAAYALKDSGYHVCVVESLDSLGGTHVNSGVVELLSSPVPEYFKDIVKSIYNDNSNLVSINGTRQYGDATEDTFDKLWRGGFISLNGNRANGFSTNPFALSERYYNDLVNAGVDVLLSTEFVSSSVTSNGVVENITVHNNHTGKTERIWGLYFIDASSFASLCKYGRTIGVDYYQGTDDKARFNESAIPDDYVADITKVNLAEAGYMYEETEEEYDAPKCKTTDAFAVSQARWLYPNDINKTIRVMSTENSCRITRYIFDPSYGADYKYALFQAKERTKDHFKKYFGARSAHRYIKPMPLLAMRETTRVKCDAMLVQDDLTTLATSQNYQANRYVALGSWNFDLHNKAGVNTEDLPTPKELVGLPYEAIIPTAFKNVLVASKCFGASHIAAGYFRLGKTCMCIGWAAGNAVKVALDDDYVEDLRNVDIDELQAAIGIGDMLDDIETYFTLS